MSPSASRRWTLDGRPALVSASLDSRLLDDRLGGLDGLAVGHLLTHVELLLHSDAVPRTGNAEFVGSALLLLVLARLRLHRGLGRRFAWRCAFVCR